MVDNSSKRKYPPPQKKKNKKKWSRWISTPFQLPEILGKMGLHTLSVDHSTKNKTIVKILGVDGSPKHFNK